MEGSGSLLMKDFQFYFWCAVIALVALAAALAALGGLFAFLGWCWRLF